MMSFLTYDRAMRRLWVFKRRCHHGMTGCVLVALGIVLAYHDRNDYREWFALKRYEPRP
jgi:hypothetical protein